MRQPSDKLMHLLTELQLCSPQDIAACESRVHQLCHDLPDFDSVWVDALVQQQTLTPWQATVLQSRTPNRLRVDDFCLRDQIGNHSYHAVALPSERHVLLQQFSNHQPFVETHLTWLEQQLKQLETQVTDAPAALELPRRLVCCQAPTGDTTTYVASRFVPGWTAQELLIRGGRMPWPTVAEIGQQLLSALCWLEEHNTVHGDISLQNVRLTPQGQTVLVAALSHPMARQGLSLTAGLQLKDVATMAPERIGRGIAANVRSELYSVGCVLWQLLTARPPFLSADPVTKTLQSQEHDVPDVRGLVPDCPDGLARLIHNLTRRSPELRPESAVVAAERFQNATSSGTQHTRRLLHALPDRSRQASSVRRRTHARRSPAPALLAASAMVALFATYGIQRGLLPTPLTMSRSSTQPEDSQLRSSQAAKTVLATSDTRPETTANGLRKMPSPDTAGVVVLQSGSVYEATDLDFAGVMHIETTGSRNAVVKTSATTPWRLTAAQIVLTNVDVSPAVSSATSIGSATTVVLCECDVLSVQHCVIDSGQGGGGRDRALQWEPRTAVTSVVSIADSVFMGSGYAVWLSQPPARCKLQNVLTTTRRATLRCDVNAGQQRTVRLNVSRVTQVGSVSFLDVVIPTAGSAQSADRVQVVMECGESVLASSTGLVQFAGPKDWSLANASVEFLLPERGNPTIVPPDVRTAIGFDSALQTTVDLQPSQVRAEALLIAVPVFQGDSDAAQNNPFAAFHLLDYEGPKLSPQLPGVDVAALPRPSTP